METTLNTITKLANYDFEYETSNIRLTLDDIPIYRLFADLLLQTRSSEEFHQCVENRIVNNFGFKRGEVWKLFREKITPSKYTLGSHELYKVLGVKTIIKIMRGKKLKPFEKKVLNVCYNLANLDFKTGKLK